MATFEITANGGTYHVEAPDEHAAVAALGQMMGGSKAPEAAAPAAAEPKGLLGTVDDYVRAAANGMTFGLADRLAAAGGAATGLGGASGDYAGNLKREQERTGQFETEHPIASIGANLAGGAIVPIGAVGAAAKGASLGAKTLLSGGTGAVLGALQGAASSNDLTDIPQTAKKAGIGAGEGLLVGGAIPAAGKAIGAGVNAVSNALRGNAEGMSRGASQHLVSAIQADGGPDAIKARLAELGPQGMLVDAGPSLLAKGQGAALYNDEGRSVMTKALTDRNEGTNARIQSDVDSALGPAQGEDAPTVTDRLRRQREEIDSRNYPAALDSAPPIQTASLMTDLIDRIGQAPTGSLEHKALTSVQNMLTKKVKQPVLDVNGDQVYDGLGMEKWRDVPQSVDDAGILHKVKGEIDRVVEHDQPGLGVPAGAFSRQQAALKQVRFNLNAALEGQVAGYAAANRASAALAKRMEAVQAGTQILGSGKTVVAPDRFAFDFAGLEPGEQIALAKGLRGTVDHALGVKGNDLQALRTELQGDGGWNTAKLGTVFGQPAADALAKSVDSNLAFRDTFNKITQNSMTAARTAALDAMKPVPSGDIPLVNPNMSLTGLLATGAKKAANAGWNAVRPDPARNFGEMANVLTAQGAARDARIESIMEALQRRKGNAAAAAPIGNSAALLSAIAANSFASRNGPKQRQP